MAFVYSPARSLVARLRRSRKTLIEAILPVPWLRNTKARAMPAPVPAAVGATARRPNMIERTLDWVAVVTACGWRDPVARWREPAARWREVAISRLALASDSAEV